MRNSEQFGTASPKRSRAQSNDFRRSDTTQVMSLTAYNSDNEDLRSKMIKDTPPQPKKVVPLKNQSQEQRISQLESNFAAMF